jgi:hypothetical protein
MSSVYYAPTALYHIFEDIKAQDPDNFGGQKLLLGGILGDARHFAEGGYHVPRQYLELNLPGDYSIQLPVDEVGDPYAASAIDLTPGSQDGQHLLTRRLLDATRAQDPRLRPVREWAGSLDSVNVTAWSLRPYPARDVSGMFDKSHIWHHHISIDRKWCNDAVAMQGLADLLAGVPYTGHNTGGGPTTIGHHKPRRVPRWPLQHGYFGLLSGPRASHGGATRRERRLIRRIQRRLQALGYLHVAADGIYGPVTAAAVAEWQARTRAAYTTRPGEVWADDWRALFTPPSGAAA